MGRRWKTMLVALGLTVAGVAGAGPAQAAGCTITNFSPREVAVGLSPVTKTFGVSASGCRVLDWDVNDSEYNFWAFSGSPQDTINPYFLDNSDAGRKDVIATVYDSSYRWTERTFVDGFKLLRRTEWQGGSFNASPEPVLKGAPVTIKGRLRVVDWTAQRYVPFGSRQVAVQFRTAKGTWTTVKTVATNSDGWIRTTVPASVTGVWRLRYGGGATTGPSVSPEDTVAVTG